MYVLYCVIEYCIVIFMFKQAQLMSWGEGTRSGARILVPQCLIMKERFVYPSEIVPVVASSFVFHALFQSNVVHTEPLV